jgi:hypothetical protein
LLWHALRSSNHSAVDIVTALAGIDWRIVDQEAEAVLLSTVSMFWQNGWQPAELIRFARRGEARIASLAATAVAADHSRRSAATLAPEWVEQVRALGLPDVGSGSGWLSRMSGIERLDRIEVVEIVVRLLLVLGTAGPLPRILTPPGAQRSRHMRDVRRRGDDPLLVKVRALLAQAESTTFEAEAEAFTAKAQELMARHAIDDALLWAQSERDERPITIRVPLDDPYSDAQSLLLQHVARHSRCKAVYHPRYGLSSLVGFASDVASAETLFTSLLVQSHAALRAEGAQAPAGSRSRSRSFRSAFLLSYVTRIDERLAEVTEHVEAAARSMQEPTLVPVLLAREGLVDDSVAELFGTLDSLAVRGTIDPAGWARGRLAADRAHLSAGDVAASSTPLDGAA